MKKGILITLICMLLLASVSVTTVAKTTGTALITIRTSGGAIRNYNKKEAIRKFDKKEPKQFKDRGPHQEARKPGPKPKPAPKPKREKKVIHKDSNSKVLAFFFGLFCGMVIDN